jgi:hypothetical protein
MTLWELACQRWSPTMMRAAWMNTLSGPPSLASQLPQGIFGGHVEKGLAVRAKPPVAVTAATDMYTIKNPAA